MTTRKVEVGIAVAAALAVTGLFFIFSNPFDFMAIDNSLGGGQGAAAGSASQFAGAEGLVAQDQIMGTGSEAKMGDTVRVHYTGKFENGTVFDTSVGGSPFEFMLGAGEVIAGWDQGLAGMKVGGKRTLIVPPALGYGASDYGPIPGGSTLIFEVELVSVVSSS